jgi:hypothetical protein
MPRGRAASFTSPPSPQARQSNLLSQHTIIEREIGGVPLPIVLLRPAWFMENFSWDVPSARVAGVIRSFLQPLDKPVPMVATADIGLVSTSSTGVTSDFTESLPSGSSPRGFKPEVTGGGDTRCAGAMQLWSSHSTLNPTRCSP